MIYLIELNIRKDILYLRAPILSSMYVDIMTLTSWAWVTFGYTLTRWTCHVSLVETNQYNDPRANKTEQLTK